jgi:hypothetical protein
MRIHAKWALVALLGIPADGFSWETGRGDNKPGPAELNFGVLRPMDGAAARAKAEELARLGGASIDPARVAPLWLGDRVLADRVADTIALGSLFGMQSTNVFPSGNTFCICTSTNRSPNNWSGVGCALSKTMNAKPLIIRNIFFIIISIDTNYRIPQICVRIGIGR